MSLEFIELVPSTPWWDMPVIPRVLLHEWFAAAAVVIVIGVGGGRVKDVR